MTIETAQHTRVVVANVRMGDLRVENLSAADRRRLELIVTVPTELTTEALRAACDEIEGDLDLHEKVSKERPPHVWISGAPGGLQLKASLWLRKASRRREAQRDLLLLSEHLACKLQEELTVAAQGIFRYRVEARAQPLERQVERLRSLPGNFIGRGEFGACGSQFHFEGVCPTPAGQPADQAGDRRDQHHEERDRPGRRGERLHQPVPAVPGRRSRTR